MEITEEEKRNYKKYCLNGLDIASANASFLEREDVCNEIRALRDKICQMINNTEVKL